ncbi:S41 family peptidase [Variovorax sp. LARHSF232]
MDATAIRCQVALALAAAVLAACGGGGGSSSSSSSAGADAIVPSASVAGLCAKPRQGLNPATGGPYGDQPGTLDDEKRWLRAWIDEAYLWWNEVPAGLKAADFATPIAYFDALKTPLKTASGRPKDRFHYSVDTAQYQRETDGAPVLGYGMEIALLRSAPPRDARIAYVVPGAPAAQEGLARGDKLLVVDGVDVASGPAAPINAALSPSRAGETHAFTIGRADGSVLSVTLGAASIAIPPVMNTKTLASASGPVGYLQFNDHSETAEAQLIAAIQQLQAAGIKDLVLDMRYNGGGLLGIASELAYMVAGRAATQGKTFERLLSNGKNTFALSASQSSVPFHPTAQGYSAPAGQALPQLGLARVTLLSGPDTCSASESVINGLRGVGVAVQLVGGTTCGKPYAFTPRDNCGTTYFAINYQGVNDLGQGDYGDGFAPACVVADDFDHALGDPAEARLAAALALRAGGSCPIATASASAQKAGVAGAGEETPYLRRAPSRENKIIDRPVP